MDALKKGFSMAKEGVVAAAEKTKAGVEEAAAKTKEGVMYVGNKTKDGMVAGVNTVAQRTTDQANIVGDATVSGANELSQQTVEGLENVAVNSGLVNQGDFSQGAEQAGQAGQRVGPDLSDQQRPPSSVLAAACPASPIATSWALGNTTAPIQLN
ncbi:unnamed protein product [Coregonus sp. 'balchen']|nr:unnamed protein product [Coregonus sp. 'balchen']